ncbi:MAG: prepilin-type N-terminal cleavage/methylation domain-containing protein [Myxococcales bacterium]|nr:prepilin-type N-terminal cleavage/methylation domain-containing protein [Myxococcales bacterium]MCB9520048.1 prepilin-type N-terminal cleavage/methylation domain-containing protein [Myxococcales bacterium]
MRRRTEAGYSLLEVIIAMAILATSLTILLGAQAASARMSERANQMALAALLARSKMLDIEGELLRDGFSATSESGSGNFRDEGFDQMEWEAEIEVVEIDGNAQEQLNADVYGQLFGSGEEGGTISGSSAVSNMMPMIIGMVPGILNGMAQRMRKVTLVITWPDGEGELSLTVQQYVVNLSPDFEPPPSEGL